VALRGAIVVTKVPDYGEFILSELTQPFESGRSRGHHSDLTYFFPLMAPRRATLSQAEQRLGRKPIYGTFDAAFESGPSRGHAWYVYAYFHGTCEAPPHEGFAVVPFSEKGGKAPRRAT